MTEAFTRGRVCGVENCPTNLWHIVNGRPVCRYGHVAQGIEIGLDDEDFTQGQYISSARTRLIKEERASTRLFGAAEFDLYSQCFLKVLIVEAKSLVERLNMPPDVVPVIRALWLMAIDYRRTKRPASVNKKTLMTESMALCYLGCIYLGLPVFPMDFFHWAKTDAFPFINASRFLAPGDRNKLSSHSLYLFSGGGIPSHYGLRLSVVRLASCFAEIGGLQLPPVSWQLLLWKLVKNLLLPPATYLATISLIHELRIEKILGTPWSITERDPMINTAAALVVTAKLAYGMDHIHRDTASHEVASDHPDWEVWADIVRKLWIINDDLFSDDFEHVMYWDRETSRSFMSWFRELYSNVTPADGADPKMLEFFPIDKFDKYSYKDNLIDRKVIEELTEVLYKSIEPVKKSAGSETPHWLPGNLYFIYNRSCDAMSPNTDILCEAIARILGIERSKFDSRVVWLEGRLATMEGRLAFQARRKQDTQTAVED